MAKLVKPLPLFKAAFTRLDDMDGWYSLGATGSKIRVAKPDFDPRSCGHSKLSNMVKALDGIETKAEDGHLMIRLKP